MLPGAARRVKPARIHAETGKGITMGLCRRSFSDSHSVPTDENRRILRDFRRFFRQGLQYRHLTRRLYEHLTRCCGFVVRRRRRGFYETYIENPDGLLRFLDQFDRRAGCPSAETGSTDWLEGEHADLNNAMVDAVRGMIAAFRDYAHRKLAEGHPVRRCA